MRAFPAQFRLHDIPRVCLDSSRHLTCSVNVGIIELVHALPSAWAAEGGITT